VVYKNENGDSKFSQAIALNPVKENGNLVTYHLKKILKNPGAFRYAFRIYPNNPDIPHRQGFAYVKWI
jgi:starch phosphorylase